MDSVTHSGPDDSADREGSSARAPAGGRRQADSPREDATRARLLSAAGPIFARDGFDRATVREICRAAGVNVALVGYYFGDKFGLYREVFRSIRTKCQDEHPVPDSGAVAPREELFHLVCHLLSRMLARDDSGWESQLMMREMNHPTEVFVEMVEESFRPLFERLRETIEKLSPQATPIDVLEKLTLSVVGQCLYYRVGSGVVRQLIPVERLASQFTIEQLARHITGVVAAAAEGGLSRQISESFENANLPTPASESQADEPAASSSADSARGDRSR